ncbi:radical SAM protein [Citrobacter freundii]|nr:radical SAM protein [Citrobacter freundii]
MILPTEQCNFRCTYCYEDFTMGRMNNNTIKSLKKLIKTRVNGLQVLKLNWFGGEPLLATSVISDLMEYSGQMCREAGVKLYSEMTTNGYLLSYPLASRLIELGVTNYQISIDGNEKYHNLTRVSKKGHGTFARIWDNLLKLKASPLDFRVTIRLHLTPQNILEIPNIINKINSELLSDHRFSIFIKEIGDYGGFNSGNIKTLKSDTAAVIKNAIYDSLKKNNTSSKPYVCYAGKANSFIIRSNGDISKCTVALSSQSNIVGKLNNNGTLTIRKDKITPWLSGFFDFNLKTLSCPANRVLYLHSMKTIPIINI